MADNKEIDLLFQTWTREFKRAIEMLTGEIPAISCRPVQIESTPASDSLDSYLWWKQPFASNQTFAVWLAVAEPLWSHIGGAMAAAGDSAENAFLEVLAQTHQATASVLSTRAPTPLRCESGERQRPADLDSLVVWEVRIAFGDTKLPPIIAATESAAAHIIASLSGGNGVGPGHSGPADESYTPMLRRLMDLELPLAVALGHATLPIHYILKMTSGSLIELDRSVGEYVDLVVHGTVVARGEIVSVKGNYGVRIKEIISRQDRLALRGAA